MVTGEDDDGVLVQTALLQGLEQLANTVVDVADGAVVGTLGALDLVIGEVVVLEIDNVLQALTVRVELALGNADLGHVDVDTLVHVPVLLLNGVRVVRVSKRDGQAKGRLPGGLRTWSYMNCLDLYMTSSS